jgi:opine dehydrogenase
MGWRISLIQRRLLGSIRVGGASVGSAIAILGAGNVGKAIAGHLALQGHEVRLYNRWESELEPLRARGGIELDGEISGIGRPAVLTTSIPEAIEATPLVLVTAPAFAHRFLSEQLAKHLSTDQVVVFQPAVLGSSLELLTLVSGVGRPQGITAETETSLYTCRATAPGKVYIGAVKLSVRVAAVPPSETGVVLELLDTYFPGRFAEGQDVLTIGLANSNPVYHCPPSILNFAGVEQGEDRALHELVTPGIADVIDALDKERMTLGRALGVELRSFWDFLKAAYAVSSGDLVERIQAGYGRQAFRAPASTSNRYFTEDIPFGLVTWSSLGRALRIDMPITDALITVANRLLSRDLAEEGRTVASLGLTGLSVAEIRDRIIYGHRSSQP